jgi:hypothetical protein
MLALQKRNSRGSSGFEKPHMTIKEGQKRGEHPEEMRSEYKMSVEKLGYWQYAILPQHLQHCFVASSGQRKSVIRQDGF